MDISLKYGLNPHQHPARVTLPPESPLRVRNGTPGYVNIIDAVGAWQLARELKQATGVAGAASFKHASPAGAAIAADLGDTYLASQFLTAKAYSPGAAAYIRARGGDRMCSFGDAAAVSEVVDRSLANVLRREVSDLIIAPGYEPDALEVLRAKKGGGYLVLEIDADFEPPAVEQRTLFGLELEQPRNDAAITRQTFSNLVTDNRDLPESALDTLIVATIALKYTQSNSVCVAYDGQVIGMGAGQQSRIHCTRLACDKADKWFLQQHPRTLDLPFREGLKRTEKTNLVDQYLLWEHLSGTEEARMLGDLNERPVPISPEERRDYVSRFEGICLSSDAFIPFRDNIDRAGRSNVRYVAQTGGSAADQGVTEAADEYGMVMAHTSLRLFVH
ncbi:MAG: phosphoribosylaminoimidazolecarboxamide formyltransferase [Gemmatimonadetes bacterium]|nr:phosphoribosylaminoimidazolecarboxamide formyltransferase [Gemmatimonadota bacterium]MYH20460.1 phosphoribosylaminoimidazolecarboxamide formyltransferase [Gemmatimonadota bacterium]MYK98942.1 phosphoribosylaminoimidazolecarboxamide formyltransferase [Gemmatimonadota bacterium]